MIKREIRTPMLGARLRKAVITLTNNGVGNTATVGGQDYTVDTDNGNSSTDLLLRELSKREMVTVMSAGEGATNAATGNFNSPLISNSSGTVSVSSAALTFDEDADLHLLALGTDNSHAPDVTPQVLKATWLSPRLEVLTCSGAGVPTLGGSGYSVVRNGLGDYTVTMKRPFKAVPTIVVTPEDTTHDRRSAQVDTVTKSSFNVTLWDETATADDYTFHCLIAGSDHRNDSRGKRRKPVTCQLFRPRLLAASVDGPQTGFTSGGNGLSIVNLGVGTFRLDFDKPYKYPPTVVVQSSNGRYASVNTVSTSSASIYTSPAAGGSTTVACQVMILGTDQAALR